MKPYGRGPALLAAALLLGGLRDPLLFALGGSAVWLTVLLERPALGPAAAWLPWLAWAAVAAAASVQPWAALPVLARWSTVVAFASLAAAWGEREREEAAKAAGATALVLAAAAVFSGAREQWLFGPNMIGLLRPYYNYTAFALAAVGAGGAAIALHRRAGRRVRFAGAAVAAVCVFCVILSRSRGACLGLAVGGVAWCVRRWGARAAAAAAFVALLAAGAMRAGVGPSSWRDAFVKRERRFQEVRPLIWRAAAATASEKPILGEGPGSFSAGYRRHPVEAVGSTARWGLYADYAHSEILQAAAETGWAGLLLWLFGFVSALRVLLRRTQEEPWREAAAVALAAMSVQLLVDNMLQLPGLAMLFFAASAAAAPSPAGGRKWPRAAAFAGCLLAMTAWMPRTLARANPGRAVALFPAESERREDLAYALMNSGRANEADPVWSEASRLAPFNAIYPYQRARIAAATGRWSDAEAFARRAAELEPDYLNDRILRAEALWRLKRSAEARAELSAIAAVRAARDGRSTTAHYDDEIWGFDEGLYGRVSALARGAR